MKRIIMIMCFVASMCFTNSASAVPYTWTDMIDLGDPGVLLDSWNEKISLTHNITDGVNPFNRGWDSLSDYQITIGLTSLDHNVKTKAFINLPGSSTDTYFDFLISDATLGASIQGLAMLEATGKLTLTIINARGAFYVEDSYLEATGDAIPGAVPEPGTLVLLGAGLLSLGIYGRKRTKK